MRHRCYDDIISKKTNGLCQHVKLDFFSFFHRNQACRITLRPQSVCSLCLQTKCRRFNCLSRRVSGNWSLMSERVNSGFWQARQHLKHGANSSTACRQHVHKIHITNNSGPRTTSSSALNKKHMHTSVAFSQQRRRMQDSTELPNFPRTIDDLLGQAESYFLC